MTLRAIDREALAWAAGLFDGEGCTYMRDGKRGRDRPEITLSITQCYDADVLHRFRAAVGVGHVTGPVNESGTGQGPRWNYRALRTTDSLLALDLIWPWLGVIKRAQATRAVEAYRSLVPVRYLRPAFVTRKLAIADRWLTTRER